MNSSRSDWEQQLKILRSRLETAINFYTALEQPPHSPDESSAKASAKSAKRLAREVKDAVADVATALGVAEVRIKVELKGGRWTAYVVGNSKATGTAEDNPFEAIGVLLWNHPVGINSRANITIEPPQKQKRR